MSTSPSLLHVLLLTLVGGHALAPGGARADQAGAERLFVRRVWPLIQERCLACHGQDEAMIKGGLDLRTRPAMLRGGATGRPALVPGKPEESLLHVAVTRKRQDLAMPPKENDRLSAAETGWIREWIAGGAPWPDPARWEAIAREPWGADEGITVRTSGGLSSEWTNRKYRPEDLWAYRPIREPAIPPRVIDPTRIANPIDAFIQTRLAAKGVIRLAGPADRRTLIRRVTFDLTGLPPTPGEVEAFLKDTSADAYERLVERLLHSPHYGEQMARHWLDVVRYADTSGFSNDYERPHAWRYRDYVIRAFNEDRPYDRFVLEQLAGDELGSRDPELLIATGFLRMGPWEHTGMSVAALTRQHMLDDVTHAVGVTFLGQGLRCASCHDHKFDPIPTRDYYRLQAVFATMQPAEPAAPFRAGENVGRRGEHEAMLREELRQNNARIDALTRKSQEALARLLRERGVTRYEELPPQGRPRRDTLGLSYQDLTLKKVYQRHRETLERELLRFAPRAFAVYSGPFREYLSRKPIHEVPAGRKGPAPEVRILAGGSLESPLEPVEPGALSVVGGMTDSRVSRELAIPEALSGRRLALARWIAARDNPLTARVIVNRVWQWHLGRGIVATPNNLGKMGARPTHPELLDWLALRFVEGGWSIKRLSRLILTSATYRQAGEHPDQGALARLDARNELLGYFPPRRLAAEEVRDTMLALTGELSREVGGPGVFPEISWEVAFQPRHVMGGPAPAYRPSPTPRERNRRSIYAFRIRTLADPLLEVFNQPGSETSCERRDETTVTPQAFALLNSEVSQARALGFALALEKRAETLEGRIAAAFRLAYGRGPTPGDREACRAHVARMTEHHRRHTPPARRLPTRIRRHMVEEMTGEDVSWDEELAWVKTYRRDTMPWEVGPETRALAELCLVLFSSNELLYVR